MVKKKEVQVNSDRKRFCKAKFYSTAVMSKCLQKTVIHKINLEISNNVIMENSSTARESG